VPRSVFEEGAREPGAFTSFAAAERMVELLPAELRKEARGLVKLFDSRAPAREGFTLLGADLTALSLLYAAMEERADAVHVVAARVRLGEDVAEFCGGASAGGEVTLVAVLPGPLNVVASPRSGASGKGKSGSASELAAEARQGGALVMRVDAGGSDSAVWRVVDVSRPVVTASKRCLFVGGVSTRAATGKTVGPALSLDADLRKGHSGSSCSFGNPPLVLPLAEASGDDARRERAMAAHFYFDVVVVEAWALVA